MEKNIFAKIRDGESEASIVMKNEFVTAFKDIDPSAPHHIIIIPNKEIYDVEKKLKSFYNGWKAFAFKDNIINVAIGMIIATSFKMLVNSLVSDIIMPIFIGIGAKSNTLDLFIILVPGRSHNTTYYTLKDAQNDGAVTLNYGNFIHNFCNLIIISLLLYLIIKFIDRIKKTEQFLKKQIEDNI